MSKPSHPEAPRPPRILLRSAWQTVNIGDIGHTPGVIRLLGDHVPEAQVTLWAMNVGDGVEAVLRRRFPALLIEQGETGSDGQPLTEGLQAAFRDCDFLLHGSGPYLVGQKDVSAWRHLTGKPYGFYGITLSSLDSGGRALLDGARFVYFRDTISLQWAKGQGLACPTMEFAPDGAFGADLRNDEAALAFLRAHGLEDGAFICAIPHLRRTEYWKIHGRSMTDVDRPVQAMNDRFKEHDHAPVRAAIVAFVRQTGMKVLVCPEDKSHMAVGKEMLVDPLPPDVRANVVWRHDYWLTDEAISTYRRALALLSMDMHSPIMAVANGTPAILCRFQEHTCKTEMWRDIGLGAWHFDLDDEQDRGRIAPALLAIARDPAAARAKAAAAMRFVQRRQGESMSVLRATLQR